MIEAAIYYEMQVEGLGKNFLDIIEAAVAETAENPGIWPEIEQGIQRRLIRRFPYSILYTVYENELVIIAIMHQKQKPRYWIGRL
ncbi:type II toxin-antitoxin system RelE/ParE family toxin [Desulfobacter sp.]|jgi:plasmid stabilization system protein ParE|uniref:type II toxin-antitoxin system RelE/ParE family toxin n=1 Tax=Desulfobacter sp. TaxID=2294 RepID=UPI003D0ADCEA